MIEQRSSIRIIFISSRCRCFLRLQNCSGMAKGWAFLWATGKAHCRLQTLWFFLSAAFGYVTRAILLVDGGCSLYRLD